MFISKWKLHPRTTCDSYSTHQRIWKAFPDGDRSFLFLVANENMVVVKSKEEPKDVAVQAVRELTVPFEKGGVYRFITCVNPTIRRSNTGKIEALVKDDEILVWLKRKLEPAGNLKKAYIKKRTMRVGRKKQMRFSAVDMEGIVECTDSEMLKKISEEGIGREKGFGCGMMILQRIG